MKNKKSMTLIDTVIVLAIGLFVAFVIMVIIPKLLGKEAAEAKDFISSTGDFDTDGIANYFDKCDCEPGEESRDGCPIDYPLTGESAKIREEACQNTMRTSKSQK